MTNILLTVSYDGTDFCGWQRQDKSDAGMPVRTVQCEIEKALQKMLGTSIKLYGSGRTDSGVHAAAQAANFISPVDGIKRENYLRALNGLLPPDIRIMDVVEKDMEFNSRFSATSRKYRYFIQCENYPFADESRYRWYIPRRPDILVLNDMASCLRGEIDCATFAASGDQSLSTMRYLENAFFYWNDEEKGLLVFEIQANAFLWKMVRSITGTIIECEKKGYDGKYFREILESHDRSRALTTAPATGLFLWKIFYDGPVRHDRFQNISGRSTSC